MSSNILLNVLDIYLDTENPRHDPINDQTDIIAHLLAGERVKTLARHIADNGMNPLDMVGVVKDEEDNYIVVEGNRRLCALHLLNDPDKAPTGEVPYFKRLSKNSTKINNSINCVLFDDHDEANIWKTVRHNGEQDGIGIRPWDSKQRTRHNAKINRKDQNALSLSLIEYATNKNFLTTESSERIITTAARYLGNPAVRKAMRISSSRSEQDVKITASCEDFDKVLKRFCDDLVENDFVNSRSRKVDWEDYADLLIRDGIAPKEKVDTHLLSECLISQKKESGNDSKKSEESLNHNKPENTQFDKNEVGDKKDAENNTVGNNGGASKNPDKRKYILPNDFQANINNKILRRVFQELKNIEVDMYPLAASQVARAFLENIYILFYEKATGSYTKQQTHLLMDKIIKEIELDSTLTKVECNALGALRRVQSNELNVLSPKTLGANAHAGIYPDPKQLKREFDNISDIIKYMLYRI